MAPHLVESYFTFTKEGFDPITIGGIDGPSQSGLSLTTIITYYLPNEVNGCAATMSIAGWLKERPPTPSSVTRSYAPCKPTLTMNTMLSS
jgi:hypothetical protein